MYEDYHAHQLLGEDSLVERLGKKTDDSKLLKQLEVNLPASSCKMLSPC